MQNKGFVKVFAVLLTLVCVFYLSFSFVTRHYTNKAKEIANGDPKVEQDYLDSLSNEKVMLWNWTLKQCREMEISLGLDLKGGMNVILEISVPDVLENLADHKTDVAFVKAMKEARAQEESSQSDFITLFVNAYHKNAPGHRLAEIFATQQLQQIGTATAHHIGKAARQHIQAVAQPAPAIAVERHQAGARQHRLRCQGRPHLFQRQG